MKLNFLVRICLVCSLLPAINALAEEARPMQDNAAVEAQVQRLSTELRCLVCQNQTLADSDADLAQDLKQEIREMAAKRMTDQAIIDYLVERYGDFVRYRPALKASTILLWIGPFAFLLAGGFGLFLKLRGRQKMDAEAPLTEAEVRKVNALLNEKSE